MRGRPPKPTALKLLQGNPGKRRLNANEPAPPPASTEPPDWLDELARAFWDEHAPPLIRRGLLTTWDVPMFATACSEHSLWVRYTVRINKHPFGKAAKDWSRLRNMALANRDRTLSKFGMSPSDRARLGAVGAEMPEDAAESFLS